MNFKERMVLKAAEKLVGKMKKEDLLIPLRDEIKKLGLVGKEDEVNAAMKRIEESGFKSIFNKLGVTKEDIEEVFKE